MLLKQWKVSYFEYSFFVASILSTITFVATLVAPHITSRLINLFVYYLLLNMVLLITAAFIANYGHFKINNELSKNIFVLLTTTYSFFYIISSIVFIRTGQSIRTQSILFTFKINLLVISMLIISLVILILIMLAFFINRKISFYGVESSKALWSKRISLISIVLLITLIFFVSPRLNIENKLVKMYNQGDGILWMPQELNGTELTLGKINLTEPNVVFILLESISTESLSHYGYPRNVSPNIDSLAEKGIVFKNAYTSSTHSDYAQPGYLSSNYVLVNNYRNLFSVQENQNAVWQIFNSWKYKTYYFSSQDDLWADMNNYFNYSALDVHSYSLTDNKTDYGSGLGKKDYDHKTVEDAIKVLNNSLTECQYVLNGSKENTSLSCYLERDTPLFVYFNLQATHTPYVYLENESYFLPDEDLFFNSSKNDLIVKVNRYDNSLRYVDAQVGKIVKYFEEIEQINNTVFVIASDHGHDLYTKHDVNGHGLSLYEDEIRIPLIIYYPGIEKKEIGERISHIDVLPTLIKMLGKETSSDFRGNLMETNERIIFYAQNHMNLLGMIEGDLKIIIDLNRNIVEIYNLKKDPLEEKNLIYDDDYSEEILTLLMWHNCQLNYFSIGEKPDKLKKYCEVFN